MTHLFKETDITETHLIESHVNYRTKIVAMLCNYRLLKNVIVHAISQLTQSFMIDGFLYQQLKIFCLNNKKS